MYNPRIHFARTTIILLLCVIASAVVGQPLPRLPAWYKNNARIHQYLINLQTRFPNNIHIDSVGFSQHDSLPIWMARLSNNPTILQDKPRVLLVGQVHAEEVLGVELCCRLAAEICSTYSNGGSTRYIDWRNQTEIYIIPSANPEGLQQVTDTLDISYRKNKRWEWFDRNGTQPYFHYIPITGRDTDGVDLNRNYPFNWAYGDTFLMPLHGTETELYDYYRGRSPGSESETQTIMRLVQTLQPMFSIIYHSSRQGTISQNVYYPWDWGATGVTSVTPGRHSPDYGLISQVGAEVAGLMIADGGSNPTYVASGYRTPNGEAGDWAYQAIGCDMMHIEIGSPTQNALQPDSAGAWQIFNHVIAGNYVLFNRILNTNPTGSSITGIVRDSISNQPIAGAEVRVRELYNRILAPRVTNSVGRFNRALLAGVYTLEFRKYGYATRVVPNIILSGTQRRPVNTTLFPLVLDTVHFHIRDNNGGSLPSVSRIVLLHPDTTNDTLITDGSGDLTQILPADTFIVIVNHPGYIAFVDTLIPTARNYNHNIVVYPVGTAIQEGFENGLSNWTSDNGSWGTDDQSYSGGHGFADSPGGFAYFLDTTHCYASNANTWAMWSNTFDLAEAANPTLDASLTYWIKGSLEPEHDSSWVEISLDGGNSWQALPGTSKWKLHFDWEQVNVSLRPYLGHSNVKFRWRLVSDDMFNQDGIHIDEIEVRLSNTLAAKESVVLPNEYRLGEPYPNPFNSTLRIPYSVKVPGEVTFRIYDVTGRTVTQFHTNPATAGRYSYYWNASQTVHGEPASGLYFIEMRTGQFRAIQKVMLLK